MVQYDALNEKISAKLVKATLPFAWTEASTLPDLAIFELEGLPDSIATSSVDLNRVNAGEAVTLVGYGCEFHGGPAGYALKELSQTILGPKETIYPNESDPLHQSYVFTSASHKEGSCSGDSGGPVLRNGAVVAVMSFSAPAHFIKPPDVSGHSRVDVMNASAWAGLGIITTGTATPTSPPAPGDAGATQPTGGAPPDPGGAAGAPATNPPWGGSGGAPAEEPPASPGSCEGNCGSSGSVPGSSPPCYCDSLCTQNADCCSDAWICPT